MPLSQPDFSVLNPPILVSCLLRPCGVLGKTAVCLLDEHQPLEVKEHVGI